MSEINKSRNGQKCMSKKSKWRKKQQNKGKDSFNKGQIRHIGKHMKRKKYMNKIK